MDEEAFVVHVVSLTSKMSIHPAREASIASLNHENNPSCYYLTILTLSTQKRTSKPPYGTATELESEADDKMSKGRDHSRQRRL